MVEQLISRPGFVPWDQDVASTVKSIKRSSARDKPATEPDRFAILPDCATACKTGPGRAPGKTRLEAACTPMRSLSVLAHPWGALQWI